MRTLINTLEYFKLNIELYIDCKKKKTQMFRRNVSYLWLVGIFEQVKYT